VVIGEAYPTTSLIDLTVTNASVSARRIAGLLAGETETTTVLRAHVDGHVTITPEPYKGDPTRAGDIQISRSNSSRVGGLIGSDEEETSIIGGHLDVRITGEADRLTQFGGVIGYQDDRTFLSDFTANIVIDLTVREVGTSGDAVSGMLGSYGLDEWSIVADSHVMLDMTLRAPSTSAQVQFRDIGGMAGNPEEGTVSRSSVTGSLTIDTSKATGVVVIQNIGGAFGRVASSYTPRLVESHIDVDVTIIGDAERVGGLVGFSDTGQFIDLRVGGSVSITGNGTEVGGLIGYADSSSGRNSSTVDSVIYRGSVSVSGTQSDVGVLFGNTTTSSVPRLPVNVVNTWWDSTVNGVTATDRGLPGAAATPAQLGQSSWLAGAGFNTSVWCAHNGVPLIATLTNSPCRTTTGGGGGSTVVVVDRVRIDGADRFGTSAALSQRFFTAGVSVVYLATGTSFADALAAGPLAAGSGPILMVRHNEIPADIQAELTRLKPGRIVVLGGAAAVSDAVVAAAGAYTSGTVTRLFGEDRFATAAAISGAAHSGQVAKVYIATGTDFADALAGGPFAAGDGPILLVQSDRIPAATATELTRLKPQQIVVLGGPAAVSADLMRSLGQYASQSVSRIHGPDRYATSVAISQTAFNPGVPTLFLATGTNFADALSAGAASGGNGPVLLVRPDCVPLSVYNEIIRLNPKEIFVLGGNAAVGVGAQNLTKCPS
jgi:putative cell wall-binding protein